MIEKEIDQITEEDLQSLVEDSVLESRTIEYKSELNIGRDKDKKEFLADASSFANASGGDLIFGIVEDGGVPIAVEGIEIDNFDELKGTIEHLIRNGIEPKMPLISIKLVDLSNSKKVLILRIPKSWRSPHRVILKKDYRFFSRNSHGKQFLDVEELKNAFNLSETFTERIKEFRENRLSNIIADETPVPLKEGAKIVLHIIPINSFNLGQNYDIDKIASETFRLKPIYDISDTQRYNIDGFLSYGRLDEGKSSSYVQLFRKGIVEAVATSLLDNQNKKIDRKHHERQILDFFPSYLDILNELNVETPIYVFLTILGAKGFSMYPHPRAIPFGIRQPNVIDRDVLLLPEIIIEKYDLNPEKTLKSCFDAIWNACGYAKSPNYNENGQWEQESD